MSYDGRSNSGYAGSGYADSAYPGYVPGGQPASGYADSAYPGYVPGGQPASGYVPPLGESYGKKDRENLEDFRSALAAKGQGEIRREPRPTARQSKTENGTGRTWVKVALFILALFLIVMIVGFVIDFPEDERDGRRFRRFRRLCRRTN